jgi:hypothetical protein
VAWLIALGVLMPANRRQARAMQGIVRAADAASAVG